MNSHRGGGCSARLVNVVFDVGELKRAKSHRADGCQAHDLPNCPVFGSLGGAILVAVIVFDVASLKSAYSRRDGGHPGHNPLNCHRLHGTTGGKGAKKKIMRASCCDRLTTCKTNPQHGEFQKPASQNQI